MSYRDVFSWLFGGVSQPSPCPTWPTDVDGGVRIGVDQQQGGSIYPFTQADDDLYALVADFFLAYTDNYCRFEQPFSITYLYGFSDVVADAEGGDPTPTHDKDIVVKDANGQVVFDSTLLPDNEFAFREQEWGSRLLLVEWLGDTAICRIVVHTKIPIGGTTPCIKSPYRPEIGDLDVRTLEPLLPHVQKLRVNSSSSWYTTLVGGYNTLLEVTEETDSVRPKTVITINNTPGYGIGRVPGCEEDRTLRQLNSVDADASGNVALTAQQCYWWEIPHTIEETEDGPRAVAIPHTLRLNNDCGQCPPCSDYAAVYEAIRRLMDRYMALGARAEAVRDQYRENLVRWLQQGRIRQEKPLRLAVYASGACIAGVSGGLCNNSESTVEDLELRFTFTAMTGAYVCGSGFITGSAVDSESESGVTSPDGHVPLAPSGSWPVFSYFFDRVPPGGFAQAVFQVEFAGCTSESVQVTLEAFADGSPITYNAAWPSGDDPQPVVPLVVTTDLTSAEDCA